MGRAACCWPVQLTMFSASLLAPSIICSSWMVLAAAGAVCSHGRACACCASGSCSRANTRSSIGLLRVELGGLAASSRSIASGTRTTCRICVVMGPGGGPKQVNEGEKAMQHGDVAKKRRIRGWHTQISSSSGSGLVWKDQECLHTVSAGFRAIRSIPTVQACRPACGRAGNGRPVVVEAPHAHMPPPTALSSPDLARHGGGRKGRHSDVDCSWRLLWRSVQRLQQRRLFSVTAVWAARRWGNCRQLQGLGRAHAVKSSPWARQPGSPASGKWAWSARPERSPEGSGTRELGGGRSPCRLWLCPGWQDRADGRTAACCSGRGHECKSCCVLPPLSRPVSCARARNVRVPVHMLVLPWPALLHCAWHSVMPWGLMNIFVKQ